MQDSSAHSYLERRFDKSVSLVATISYIVLTSLYLAIVVYAPSLALSQAVWSTSMSRTVPRSCSASTHMP